MGQTSLAARCSALTFAAKVPVGRRVDGSSINELQEKYM
jgi:hypothetical protein